MNDLFHTLVISGRGVLMKPRCQIADGDFAAMAVIGAENVGSNKKAIASGTSWQGYNGFYEV